MNKIITIATIAITLASGLFAQGLDTYSGKTFSESTPIAILSEGASVTNTFDTGSAIGRASLVTMYKVDNEETANLQITYSVGTNTVGHFTDVPATVIEPLALTNTTGVSVVKVVPNRFANRYLRTIVTSSATAINALVGAVFIAE